MVAPRGVLLLTLLQLMMWSSHAEADTLKEALSKAYLNNPALEAQRASLRATDERVPQALSGFRPTITAYGEGGAKRIENNSDTILTQAGVNKKQDLQPYTLFGQITQPIYRGGQTAAQTRAAENLVRQERANLTTQEQNVLFDATTAYMNVYRDQSVLDLTIRNEQRLARQLEATRDRFRVGEVTRTDVFQAEARLAQATAERIQAEGQLDQSRADYRNVVGEAPGRLDTAPMPEKMPGSLDATIKLSLAGNPRIFAAEYGERQALDTVDQRYGALLPSLSVIGRAQRAVEEFNDDASYDQFEALLRLDVPLYRAGTDYSQIREAKQRVMQQRRLIDQSRRDAIRAATQAWIALETAQAQVGSRRKQVEANQVALEGVQREAEVGARTVLDILNAEQELLTSEVDLVRSQRDEVVSAYQVKTAVGDLTAQALNLDVPYYSPTEHYDSVRGLWFGTSAPGDNSSDFDSPPAQR